MKTNQFILHYVAAGVLVAAMISATPAALATDMVPFNGTVSGYINGSSLRLVNFGNANQLGAFIDHKLYLSLPNQSRVVLPTLVSFTGWPPTATN